MDAVNALDNEYLINEKKRGDGRRRRQRTAKDVCLIRTDFQQ
jgi:hypothetical protein